MKLHLLEPYRSAFVSKCVKESLIRSVPEDAYEHSPAFLKCGNEQFISETLQIATLASDLSMVWAKAGEKPVEKGMPYMELSGLENIGVIKLIDNFDKEDFENKSIKWKNLKNLDELWALEEKEIEIYSKIIFEQLAARGKPIDYTLYRLLRASRLHQYNDVELIKTTIPNELREVADDILRIEPRLMHAFELPIFMTLEEIRLTLSTAEKNNFKVIGTTLTDDVKFESANKIKTIWAIIVEELLKEEIHFPVPSSLAEVVSLRSRNEIKDFRTYFNQLLDNLVLGNATEFGYIQGKIKDSIKSLKKFPRTKKLAKISTFVALGAGVIEALTGIIGPSIGIGVFAVGLEGIAKKWESNSSWIYLSAQN